MPCEEHQRALDEVLDNISEEMGNRVERLSEELKKRVNAIEDDMPETEGPDAEVGLSFDVDWRLETIKLHLPEVTMKEQTWIFHLPSVTMRDKKMIFHTPGICMKRKKIGQYPEVHGFAIKWKDIIVDVPEPCMKKQQIIMGVPEFRMEENKMILHVPEFSMRLKEIKLHLPEFTLKDITVEAKKTKEEFDEAQSEFQEALSREKAGV